MFGAHEPRCVVPGHECLAARVSGRGLLHRKVRPRPELRPRYSCRGASRRSSLWALPRSRFNSEEAIRPTDDGRIRSKSGARLIPARTASPSAVRSPVLRAVRTTECRPGGEPHRIFPVRALRSVRGGLGCREARTRRRSSGCSGPCRARSRAVHATVPDLRLGVGACRPTGSGSREHLAVPLPGVRVLLVRADELARTRCVLNGCDVRRLPLLSGRITIF
jgi:hypothetical protein